MSFRVESWNVNGLRAVHGKGFLSWLRKSRADLVLLQEIKVQEDQLEDELREPKGFGAAFSCGKRKGYSGVAAYFRDAPDEIVPGLGVKKYDDEGRVIEVRYGKTSYIGAYFPNGGHSLERLPFKMNFYKAMLRRMEALRDEGRRVVVSGDYNTAFAAIDLARPKQNVKNTGFLPEEREMLGRYFKAGWVDSFRHLHPEQEGAYSWWSYRMNARERNIGWRIDYNLVDAESAGDIQKATISKQVEGSDHCPVGLVLRG
ncbi:MAG: exodeoxyribonuclease III [Acidobacteriota bacterium]